MFCMNMFWRQVFVNRDCQFSLSQLWPASLRASQSLSCQGPWRPHHWGNIWISSSSVIWLAPSWQTLHGLCFSHGHGVWTWSPYQLTSSQGELFWQLMWNKFWPDMFRASSHRPVFIFIEKEQSREMWPHGLHWSSRQLQSSESSTRECCFKFQVF